MLPCSSSMSEKLKVTVAEAEVDFPEVFHPEDSV